MTKAADSPADSVPLNSRLSIWLENEGYPLEFRTANAFRQSGWQVRRGEYVRTESEAVREIDVAATMTEGDDVGFIRAYHVLECKWSKDKPWIVFSDPGGIAPSACITQAFSSLLAGACLWAMAGDSALHGLGLFATPSRPGFSGRQGFSKGSDVFYDALRSVTTHTAALVRRYDAYRNPGRMPDSAVVAFPVVVLDGKLFEAWYDESEGAVQLEERESMRLHWRGAPSWLMHATVDIVVSDHIAGFAALRAEESRKLLRLMRETRDQIGKCFETRTLSGLTVTKGGRGVVGLPPLLREIVDRKNIFDC